MSGYPFLRAYSVTGAMIKPAFVIYGAGSDIIAPVFDHFTDSDFICLINRSKPDHLKGVILETGSDDFESEFVIQFPFHFMFSNFQVQKRIWIRCENIT